MLEQIADSAAFAWPLALTCASVAVAGRLRAGRRRERLNRALHELRRPLQALTLSQSRTAGSRAGTGQLELALDALAGLDREINGGARAPMRAVEARGLAEDAVRRWRSLAARRGRPIALAWSADGSRVVCEPAAIARALDNLIANAVEHGTGPIRVEATARGGRLRLLVADGSDAGVRPAAGTRMLRTAGGSARRGHGLRVVAEVAADHGGRFAACRHAAGSSAVLELPLA